MRVLEVGKRRKWEEIGLGPERAKQARGRARGAEGKEESDEW